MADIPVIYHNPFTKKVETMPVEMIAAYLYDATFLDLESAAKIATIRDDEAAQNLLLSIVECAQPEIDPLSGVDVPSVESPSLR